MSEENTTDTSTEATPADVAATDNAAPATPSPTSSPTEEGASEDFDFSGLGMEDDDFDLRTDDTLETSEDDPAAGSQEEPEGQAQEEPPTDPKGKEPEEEPEPEPTASPEEGQANEASQPATIESLVEQMRSQEAELVPNLAEQFAISEEEATELETDAFNAVPKLLAKTYLRAIASSLQYVQHMVPGMIQSHHANMQAAQANQKAFQEAWPQIDLQKYADEGAEYARMFKQSNPEATRDDIIAMVGTALVTRHKIPALPETPAAPAGNSAHTTVASQPFNPAPAGAGGGHATNQEVEDPWAGFGQDFD